MMQISIPANKRKHLTPSALDYLLKFTSPKNDVLLLTEISLPQG